MSARPRRAADVSLANPPLKVLFVSHDASATGAPNSLLNVLDGARACGVLDFRVVMLHGGPLEGAFADRAPALVLRNGPFGAAASSLITRGIARAQARRRLARFLSGFQPDVLFLNSSAAASVFRDLPGDLPVVTYVRELRAALQSVIASGWFDELVKRTSVFIGVSEAVKANLVDNHGIAPDRVAVIPAAIDAARLRRTQAREQRDRLRALAGGTKRQHVVLGCGTGGRQKGADLFVAVAKAFFAAHPGIRTAFVWLGGRASAAEREWIDHDICQADLVGRVFFPGAQSNAAALLAGGDVLALTSRQDSFPRVMLEAGIAGVPTVCFKRSGGAQEFVARGTGIAVEYLDIAAFAEALHTLLTNEPLRRRLGAHARRTVTDSYSVDVSFARILSVLKETVAGSRARS